MKKELIDKINEIIICDISIDFRLDNGVRADKIVHETVWIDEYSSKSNTTSEDYPKSTEIKRLLLNNGYILELEKIHTYHQNDILNLRFRSKEILSKREY